MNGARGWALLAGLGLLVIAIWQIVIYTSGAKLEGDPLALLKLIQNQATLGWTWGGRIACLLLATAPLRFFAERAKGGSGVASRAFLNVWMPLIFVGALLQTQSVERLRTEYKAVTDAEKPTLIAPPVADPNAAPSATSPTEQTSPAASPEMMPGATANPDARAEVVRAFHMWRALVDPVLRTAAILGILMFAFLVASGAPKARPVVAVVVVILFVIVGRFWSPSMEALVTLIEALTLGGLALAFPREPEYPNARVPR